jgi:tetratricopeptide (TPR) repeat protein
MTSVFIVRPFGKRRIAITERQLVEVDFDAIEQSLIKPALAESGLEGETTERIAEAGNIRVDMFERLITYDLVIADISIDNANVFYELGIRHGLRPRGSILIRFSTPGKDWPFDLKTERYIAYDRMDPGGAVPLLTRSIKETVLSMRANGRADSPVFGLLPQLLPPDPASFVSIPRSFQEAVEQAETQIADGPTMLALLAAEVQLGWGRKGLINGLRIVGRAQRRLSAFSAARETWEAVRKDLPDDIEANLMLATIYQRLGNSGMAVQACRRVLENEAAPPAKRADAHSQLAGNEKAAWFKDFAALETKAAQQQAISDQRFMNALEWYQTAFTEDLNNYDSGLNALGLMVVLVRLAELQPGSSAMRFPNLRRAERERDDYREQLEQLTGAVWLSFQTARKRFDRSGLPHEWLLVFEADYHLLTSNNAPFVGNSYRAAKNALGERFQLHSELSQVAIFHRLGLLAENCSAAFAGLGTTPADPQPKEPPPPDRVVVAAGHRADSPSRPPPGRFPNTTASIDKAKGWLRQTLEAEKKETPGTLYGIAGAASGVDLLFHEVCKELGISTKVCLPIPMEDYRRRSVADGGPDWAEKFNRLVASNPPIILSDSDELPAWAAGIKNYGVFQRGNIWVMQDALLLPNADVTLIALWDQKAGEGPGGTADMVKLAKSHGVTVREQNSDTLFGEVGAALLMPNASTASREPVMSTSKRDTVFISYSHKDRKALEQLSTMLAPVMRNGKVDVWDDTKIEPGRKWRDEIESALGKAKVAVLLVSDNFLASDFIAKHELTPLLKAAQEQGVTVFWIYLCSCLYKETEIAEYQAAHDVTKPLGQLTRPMRQQTLRKICEKLVQAIQAS